MTESAGARLKKVRLEKGLSLEEVHKKTKVHLNILRAIEEDSLIDFSPIYIKGFLKIYCQFLGVDPKDYIAGYKEPQAKVEYVSDFKNKPVPLFKIRPLAMSYLKAIRIKPRILLTVILLFAFIIIVFNLGKFFSSRHGPIKYKKAGSASLSAVVSKTENKAKVLRAQDSSVVKIIRLDIRAKEDCFINVKTDGKVMFQNVLRKGRSESWQAMNKIEFSLSNAGAVELEVNGKRIQNLGRKGQALKNILITKEGLSIKR
ncbi:MAG: DUF4115 domain-containing protein [Candidatus Omnitrophica bacterium]|nr:DUF4115 domain-containing protein [Candidatus Omnitrophota bacterium]MDD5592337.1 DUF4115 domain-containing protein [Candidatus Omnitrophota bacterium]